MSEFVICLENHSNSASLIVGKVYRTLPDADAAAHNMLRILDEDTSEPDGYLYPEDVYAAAEQRYFRRQGVFFVVQLGVRLAHPSEGDHTLRWYAPSEAITYLSHLSHIWVIRRVALARSGVVLPKSIQVATLGA